MNFKEEKELPSVGAALEKWFRFCSWKSRQSKSFWYWSLLLMYSSKEKVQKSVNFSDEKEIIKTFKLFYCLSAFGFVIYSSRLKYAFNVGYEDEKKYIHSFSTPFSDWRGKIKGCKIFRYENSLLNRFLIFSVSTLFGL